MQEVQIRCSLITITYEQSLMGLLKILHGQQKDLEPILKPWQSMLQSTQEHGWHVYFLQIGDLNLLIIV